MNEDQSMNYQFLPQVFLRAPYYSFSGYDLNRLPDVLHEQAFRNAVWLASPEFYLLLEKKNFDFEQLKDKEKHTLYKYYNRMCFRPTPFGSFASFTLTEWGNDTGLKLANNDEAILHLLPDQQLFNSLQKTSDSILQSTRLMVNPTLYRFENEFRYTKSIVGEKGGYSFFLEAISGAKFNAALFTFLGIKKNRLSNVIEWIKIHGDCTDDEALDYVRFLLNEQVIFSDVYGSIIGPPISELPNLPRWMEFWEIYHSVTTPTSISLAEISAELKRNFSAQTDLNNTQSFYAALERPAEHGSIDVSVQNELSKAVEVLQLLSVYEQPKDFSHFVSEFRARFDREKVPFLLALDPDAGLPYGNVEASNPNPGVLDDLVFPKIVSENNQVSWNAVQQLLFRLWIGNTLRDPWSTLEISEENVFELRNVNDGVLPLPQSQALMYRNTGEHLIIESSGGTNGISLIGRFSSFSEQVYECCLKLADLETKANPSVVFADIGQLSDAHVDNINRRRPVYPYEIPINVYPTQPQENLIFPADLLLSFQGDELILESSRLGKRVIPRLTTAYNFRNNQLPVFRLLCDMQFQGIKAGFSFDLENFFPGLTFYPRVSYGRVVLSLAKWKFKAHELSLLSRNESPTTTLHEFRRTYHMPRHISIGSNDQQLVFDLAIANEAKFFLQCISGVKNLTITEYMLPDRSVQIGKKPTSGQIIAFLAHNRNTYPAIKPVTKVPLRIKGRSFMIGSDWLYIKIFCIPRASDTILAKVIFPFLSSERKRIKNWFFIRYNEKGYHLRLRIQAEQNDLGILLVALRKKMESGGHHKLIRNYQGDTYQREIERYGHQLINDVEHFFRAGSELVVWAIHARQADKQVWDEFELAMLSANQIISGMLPEYEQRLIFISEVVESFLIEFNTDKVFKIAIDNKYRKLKGIIADLLGKKVRLKAFTLFMKEIEEINKLTAQYLPAEKSALLADLVHMQLNRTFSIKQRQQELLVYYCLQKYLISCMARTKPIN
ncbi:hypothetical protein ASF92_19495 [Pedobacter sp. Leaf176]|nr:hypothetical protein ASF92_19495 [Pedobacter sp. Leaf176]